VSRSVEDPWTQYKQAPTPELRDQLILRYTTLVKFVAGQVGAGLPKQIELSDLVSYGIFGLIDAVEKFDPGRGIKFETYAFPRIKGAIIDELRSIDWVPRSVRARARELERTSAWLEASLRRVPTPAELAAELGEDVQHVVIQISLDEPIRSLGPEGMSVAEMLSDRMDGPELGTEVEAMSRALAAAINALSDREKTVFAPYYYDGLTLAEIGELLGVTESRVCQIHTKAVLQICSMMKR
jgi:RNA polymerase sigma factor for flagellar operon FliA